MKRWLGIDFSGDNSKWTARCTRSNVWIADVRPARDAFGLHSLKRVQAYSKLSLDEPFRVLAAALRKGDYEAAAIDAPFSVPARYIPAGGHSDGHAPQCRAPFR